MEVVSEVPERDIPITTICPGKSTDGGEHDARLLVHATVDAAHEDGSKVGDSASAFIGATNWSSSSDR